MKYIAIFLLFVLVGLIFFEQDHQEFIQGGDIQKAELIDSLQDRIDSLELELSKYDK